MQKQIHTYTNTKYKKFTNAHRTPSNEPDQQPAGSSGILGANVCTSGMVQKQMYSTNALELQQSANKQWKQGKS